MSVKLTLEFASEEEAIVALGKLVGLKARAPKNPESAAPVAAPVQRADTDPVPLPPVAADPVPEKRPRKPRADAGQPRGPNARTQNAAGASATPGSGEHGSNAGSAVTESGSGVAAGPSTVAQAPNVPQQGTATTAPAAPPAAAAPISDETVQKAVEKMFTAKDYDATAALLSRFGVRRGKDLPQDQRQNFINRVDGVVDRGEAI